MTPEHLQYDSIEEWADDLPENWPHHPNTAKRELWWKQYAELKQHLWNRHISSLNDEEQLGFQNGNHPSLSHKFQDRAQLYVPLLEQELAKLGYGAVVRIGFYHMDRIVLSAKLDRSPPPGLRGVPWLFRGFEVKYGFPQST